MDHAVPIVGVLVVQTNSIKISVLKIFIEESIILSMAEKLTLSTKVEYRKRRNPRAFKLWDSAALGSIMVNAAEIRAKIEEASKKAEKSIDNLNPTNINTELLYFIVDGYLDIYSKLLAEGLLKTGNIKSHPEIH